MKPLEEMGKFATVVIDPPWPLPSLGWRSNHGHSYETDYERGYKLMYIEDITSLPIQSVLDENALVFCWTISRWLPYTFELIEAWGVRYCFVMTWVKPQGHQFPNSPMFNSEWCVVGKKGKPVFNELKMFKVANFWEQQGHSVKPEGFYDLLRRVTPGPRLDIFGRRRIAGFTSWGNEAPEGEPLPDHYQQVLLG